MLYKSKLNKGDKVKSFNQDTVIVLENVSAAKSGIYEVLIFNQETKCITTLKKVLLKELLTAKFMKPAAVDALINNANTKNSSEIDISNEFFYFGEVAKETEKAIEFLIERSFVDDNGEEVESKIATWIPKSQTDDRNFVKGWLLIKNGEATKEELQARFARS